MRVKIYQMNADRDLHLIKFLSLESMKKFMGVDSVDPSLYDEVFNAELDTDDLEDIFVRFNTEKHPLFRGHSLSVSDVVVTGKGAFFCDSVGFKQIDFDESKTQKPDDLMRVLYVEPGKVPYEAEIRNELRSMQRAVCDGLMDDSHEEGGFLKFFVIFEFVAVYLFHCSESVDRQETVLIVCGIEQNIPYFRCSQIRIHAPYQ